jgi:simple sugar transport system ATP-binding protein
MGESLLRVEGLAKSFGKVRALDRVDLHVDTGEVVGLVGENGAGKSTLIRIISGLSEPDAGRICWKGQEVRIDSVRKARQLGIEAVHEGGLTLGILSVSDNIFLTREIKKSVGPFRFINKKAQDALATQAIAQLGLTLDVHREVQLCSGGERQGTAIARALQFDAQLLVLDEPDIGIAPSGRRRITGFIEAAKQKGLSCIFATPDVYRAQFVADRFVVMVRGTVAQVMANTKDLDLEQVEQYMRA